jgi:hypothetical protein
VKIKQKKLFRFARTPSLTLPQDGGGKGIRPEILRDPKEEPPFYVRGVEADSKDEYWCGLNLERIEKITGWTWEYQVPVYGGKNRPGGNVIDFLVHTPGMWTMLEPMGRPWHTGKREDRFQMEDVAKKKNWRLVAWFTDEVNTLEMQYQYLRRELYV